MKKFLLTVLSMILVCLAYAPNITFAEQGEWVSVSDLPFARTGSAVAEVNGLVYVFGGAAAGTEAAVGVKTNTTFVYDPEVDMWTQKKDMPTSRAGVSAVVYEENIYVLGGYYDYNGSLLRSNKVEVYNTQTDTWKTVSNMITARSWAKSVILDNMIYVIGGASETIVPIVERYDISKGTWTKMKNFPATLNAMSAESVNGKIYAIGGSTTFSSGMPGSIYEYNVNEDSWMKKIDMITGTAATATANYNGEIYMLGGLDNSSSMQSRVEVYNPETNESRLFTDLTFGRNQSVGVIVNGKIYIIGGTNGAKTLNTVEMYSLGSKEPTNPTEPPDPSEPEQPSGDRAILVVTMDTGLEKEFDLSMKEVRAFISWYEEKDSGSGTASYAINKHNNNKGPFSSRKDYVVFNKILTFEVSEY